MHLYHLCTIVMAS